MQYRTTDYCQTLIVNDPSLRPVVLPSSVTHLDKLRLEGKGTFFEFPWDVTIGNLQADGNHKLTVKSGATLTVESMYEYIQGTQCSFVIESGATLNLPPKQPVYLTSKNPLLDVSGVVTGNEIVIGDNGRLQVNGNGELRLARVVLKDNVVAQFKSGHKVGTAGDSQFKLDALVIGVASSVIFDTEKVNIDAALFEMKWKSSLNTTSHLKNITVTSDNIIIGSAATIDMTGGGQNGSGNTVGASYGGQGGGDEGGQVYGSVPQPVDYGRGSSTSRGGGVIKLQAISDITIDGNVIADGASSGSNGAGSGGSVFIVGQSVSGLGQISANGGNGGGNIGGGGGGGRVAIQVTDPFSNFHGMISAYGGNGKKNGAAGTVYKKYVKAGVPRRDIVVDNKHLVTTSKTIVSVLTDPVRLELRHDAVVTFDSVNHDITFDDLIGDYSGKVIVTAGQSVRLSTTSGLESPFAIACKVLVEEGARVALPQKVLFTDASANGPPNLELRGTLLNVREMYVGDNARVMITSKANTAVGSNVADPAGTLSFMQLHVLSGGVLQVEQDSALQMSIIATDLIQVHYNGRLSGRNMAIEAASIKVAFNAIVEVDYGGKAAGLGAGQRGAGGSYGGCGGKSKEGGVPLEVVTGSLFEAEQFGASGGNSTTGTGGAGGGILKVVASHSLQLDGTLSAQGQSGEGSGGGGSGGGVYIEANQVSGAGNVSVRGGNGGTIGGGGGGGGGGRIVFKGAGTNSFTGSLMTQGGSSTTGWVGGSGTTIINSKVHNAPYTTLHIDNGVRNVINIEGTFLKQGDNVDIMLDELHLGDNVFLRVIGSDTELTARSFHCVDSAIVYISNSLTFTAGSSHSAVTIPCSFEMEQQGEIRLPPKVTFLGKNNLFAGMLWLLILIHVYQFSALENSYVCKCNLFTVYVVQVCK